MKNESAKEPAMCAGPILKTRKPKLALPPGAADCHCHVFGPRDKYPWAANRLYTPPPVYLDDYLAMLRTTGFARGVMVQTGLYGNDNRFLVDALKAHPDVLRGIALIDEHMTDRALRDLAEAGVRGFRVNRTAKTGLAFDVARRLAERTKDLGWHVQFLLDVEDHPDLDTMLGSFATEVVIDHMGRPDPSKGVNAPGFQALIRLLKSGRGWAKLSAPYRSSPPRPIAWAGARTGRMCCWRRQCPTMAISSIRSRSGCRTRRSASVSSSTTPSGFTASHARSAASHSAAPRQDTRDRRRRSGA
jgi:predicted TIM-barrel fold metal-dependent hydrolase